MSKKNILLIEDEQNIIELIKEIFSDIYNITEVQTGESGLELVKSRKFALVIVDIKLPGISGWEVVGTFKESREYADIPVVFLTAASPLEIKQHSGDHMVVHKPFEPEDLLDIVEKVLNES